MKKLNFSVDDREYLVKDYFERYLEVQNFPFKSVDTETEIFLIENMERALNMLQSPPIFEE